MALHEVQLKGYSVRPGNLSLGTFGSYGIERLHVTLDDTWSGLAVTATFNPPKGEPREIRLPENGLIDVPAEATANEGTGTIVYCGVANGVQRITKTQGYNVITRGPVGGTEPFKPMPRRFCRLRLTQKRTARKQRAWPITCEMMRLTAYLTARMEPKATKATREILAREAP